MDKTIVHRRAASGNGNIRKKLLPAKGSSILSGKVALPPDVIPAQADSFNGLFLGNRRRKSGRSCRLLLWNSTMEPIANPQR